MGDYIMDQGRENLLGKGAFDSPGNEKILFLPTQP